MAAAKHVALFFSLSAFVLAIAGVSLHDWSVTQTNFGALTPDATVPITSDTPSHSKAFEFGLIYQCTWDFPELADESKHCCVATQGNFCGDIEYNTDAGVAILPSIFKHGKVGKCIEFQKLQAARTFAVILVILSGFGTLAIAGTDGSKGSKGFAAAAQFFAAAAGIIAFATFIDLKQRAEDVLPQTYTKFEVGFGLFTAAWLSNVVSFAAVLGIAKSA